MTMDLFEIICCALTKLFFQFTSLQPMQKAKSLADLPEHGIDIWLNLVNLHEFCTGMGKKDHLNLPITSASWNPVKNNSLREIEIFNLVIFSSNFTQDPNCKQLVISKAQCILLVARIFHLIVSGGSVPHHVCAVDWQCRKSVVLIYGALCMYRTAC